MFGFFASPEKKMRDNAANWIELAEKIYHFRRDVLPHDQLSRLVQQTSALKQGVKQRVETAKLKLIIEETEAVLRETGGTLYPRGSLVENIEFFVVAAIVILGIRTYFVQPFKIPTNSMWPSYYGMTGENIPSDGPSPSFVQRAFRLVAFGAQRKEVIAPRSGEVSALFTESGTMLAAPRNGRNWFVFPATMSEYTFFVDGQPATVRVPVDFHDFDRMVIETYFGTQAKFESEWNRLFKERGLESTTVKYDEAGHMVRAIRMPLGKVAKSGEPVLRFDLLTGDQLLVDRMSYHFVRPSVGQGFVFRTDNIRSEMMRDRAGQQIVSYYIKRLVGTPGDTLEVRPPQIFRNEKPITGASAFEANAQRSGKYTGYVNAYLLGSGKTVTVPPRSYFAMGDNSSNSQDSRYWGFVPSKDVVGRPIFIYYPFTKRWGAAK